MSEYLKYDIPNAGQPEKRYMIVQIDNRTPIIEGGNMYGWRGGPCFNIVEKGLSAQDAVIKARELGDGYIVMSHYV